MRVAALLLATAASASCASGNVEGRDVASESRDVTVDDRAPSPAPGGYDYVARRPLAVVGLAEARGISLEEARTAVNRLADTLDACVTDRSRGGPLLKGAARVIAKVAPSGEVEDTQVRVDPAPGVAAIALLCLVAPTRSLAFSQAAGSRGLAIEAIWGQLPASSAPSPVR